MRIRYFGNLFFFVINPGSVLETSMIVTILLTNNNLYIFLMGSGRDFWKKLSSKFLFYNELKTF